MSSSSSNDVSTKEEELQLLQTALETVHLPTKEARDYAQLLHKQGCTTMALLHFLDDGLLREYGITKTIHIRAILSLAKEESQPNKKKLKSDWEEEMETAQQKMDLEKVVELLETLGEKDAKVAAKGCAAVRFIIDDKADSRNMIHVQACEAVVNAVKSFGGSDKDVAEHGCAAINILANDNRFREDLGPLGACVAVIEALKSFGKSDEKVALNGCDAVGNLGIDADNKRRFRALDAEMVARSSLKNDKQGFALRIL